MTGSTSGPHAANDTRANKSNAGRRVRRAQQMALAGVCNGASTTTTTTHQTVVRCRAGNGARALPQRPLGKLQSSRCPTGAGDATAALGARGRRFCSVRGAGGGGDGGRPQAAARVYGCVCVCVRVRLCASCTVPARRCADILGMMLPKRPTDAAPACAGRARWRTADAGIGALAVRLSRWPARDAASWPERLGRLGRGPPAGRPPPPPPIMTILMMMMMGMWRGTDRGSMARGAV